MKTRVQTTSIQAYRSLRDLNERQRQVLGMLKIREMTNMELSKALGLPVNSITGRTNELVGLGFVEAKRRKICPYTGRPVTVWGQKLFGKPGENLNLFSNARNSA